MLPSSSCADGLAVELRLAADHVDGRHDHARRAEAALQTVIFAESFLHRMQLSVLCEAFDRRHLRAFGLDREHAAGLHGAAVHMNDAGAALARVAADMRAGQPQLLAQEIDEQGAVFDFGGNALAVHRHRSMRPSKYSLSIADDFDFGVWTSRSANGQAGLKTTPNKQQNDDDGDEADDPDFRCQACRAPRLGATGAAGNAALAAAFDWRRWRFFDGFDCRFGVGVAAVTAAAKRDEEVVGDLFCRAVDQALTDLRELATDRAPSRYRTVRSGAFRRQHDFRFAARKAGNAALAFAFQRAATRRIEIVERDLGFERRFDRADLEQVAGASKCVGSVFSMRSQPGMHVFSISGSLSAIHTFSGGAGIV